MPERSWKLLLIILCLLPCSVTSFNCSLSIEEDFINSFACPCSYQNTSHQFLYGSAECVPRPRPITQMSPMSTLGPGLSSLVFIIVDLAPLIVYFPVLLIFNINLASGPTQSFLFFYHVLSEARGSDLPAVESNVHFWGLLTMQSPINYQPFPRTLPYIALYYATTIVLSRRLHYICTLLGSSR